MTTSPAATAMLASMVGQSFITTTDHGTAQELIDHGWAELTNVTGLPDGEIAINFTIEGYSINARSPESVDVEPTSGIAPLDLGTAEPIDDKSGDSASAG